jgi:hypothetical protein
MPLSVLQMAKQRTRDRKIVTTKLERQLSSLNVTISYDGGMKYENVLSCGISSCDSTQHNIFALEIDLEEECPRDPCQLNAGEVAELAREYMKSQGTSLNPDTYEVYVVTHLQQNVAGPKAKHPKYRSIINKLDSNLIFTPGTSVEESAIFERMPHFFFSKVIDLKAPMENKHGSSAAVNTSQLQKTTALMKRYLTVTFSKGGAAMPDYTSMFAFVDVEALQRLVDYVAEQSADLLDEVSGIIIP